MFRSSHPLALALCACAIGVASAAPAPTGELTLANAIEAALQGHPGLAASTHELSAAQARIRQADLRPAPELGLDVENFAGQGERSSIEALESTLSLSQVIELGSKRALRRSVAEAGLGQVEIERRTRELDVLAEVTQRFIDVVAAQERLAYSRDAVALAQRTLEGIGGFVDAGKSPEAERTRAAMGVTRAEIEERQAKSVLNSARFRLAVLWGEDEPGFLHAKGDLFDLRAVAPYAELRAAIEQSPDFARFASEQRVHDAELRLARAQSRPDINFSLGVRRYEDTDGYALVGGFSMPLVSSGRTRGAADELAARAGQTEAARQTALMRARASVHALHQEMQATSARVGMLRGKAIPQAQLAVEQIRSGFERGRFSFHEFATAQEELLGLRVAAIDAAADYHRLLAEIERLTGIDFTRSEP